VRSRRSSRGLSVRFEKTALRPERIPELELLHNLARFGYRELGTVARAGEDLALETIVVAVLLRGDARRLAHEILAQSPSAMRSTPPSPSDPGSVGRH